MIRLKKLLKETNRVKRLFEQVKSLATVTFTKTFANNYITPNENWKKQADLIVAEIKKAQKQGYKLVDIEIAINGGASPLAATNIYSGPAPPNHTFGGLLKKYNLKWEKKADIDNRKPGARGSNIEPTVGNKKGGTEGNKWLALNRALKLKDLLIPYLQKYFGEVPIDLIKATGQDGTTKFVHATITPKVKKKEEDPFNIKLMERGAGYSRPFYFLEAPKGHNRWKNGDTLFFNWRLLAKASKIKQRISTNPNQTFNAIDYGAGPGVSIYISKDRMEKARAARLVDALTADMYGGDPADYQQSIWKMIQYGNSPEGKKSDQLASIYKKPLNLDKMPGRDGGPWQYINPSNGQIIVKRPMKA